MLNHASPGITERRAANGENLLLQRCSSRTLLVAAVVLTAPARHAPVFATATVIYLFVCVAEFTTRQGVKLVTTAAAAVRFLVQVFNSSCKHTSSNLYMLLAHGNA